MAKYIIPIEQQPNQIFTVQLGDKQCIIELLTRGFSIFINITVDDIKKANGLICLNKVNLIRYPDIGLSGKLYFEDTQGNLDPIYYGLNDRWRLIYEDE